MTTLAEVLAFVKSKARIATADTTRDADITLSINAAYRHVCGRDFWPFLRTTTTQALTAGTQEYVLPSDFGQIEVESVNIYITGTTNYTPLTQANMPDAGLWDQMNPVYIPGAFRIVAGTTNLLRKIRVMPQFTGIGYTLAFAYFKRIATLTGSDVLGDDLICDAVAWAALADDKDWNRDVDESKSSYERKATRALRDAQSALYP